VKEALIKCEGNESVTCRLVSEVILNNSIFINNGNGKLIQCIDRWTETLPKKKKKKKKKKKNDVLI